MLKSQPQGWESFCTCISSAEIAGGSRLHRPRSKDGVFGHGHAHGQIDYPELSICRKHRDLLVCALPWVMQGTRQLYLFISHKRSISLFNLWCSESLRLKPSQGPENKLFSGFRLGSCQWKVTRATGAFSGIARGWWTTNVALKSKSGLGML